MPGSWGEENPAGPVYDVNDASPASDTTDAWTQANQERGEEYLGILQRGLDESLSPDLDEFALKSDLLLGPERVLEKQTEDQLTTGWDGKDPSKPIYGFRPEDLVARGILQDKDFQPNNLQNDIHSIFAYHHWLGMPRKSWEFIDPALRLASRFLTHGDCQDFWITLLGGRRERDSLDHTHHQHYASHRIPEIRHVNHVTHNSLLDYFNFFGEETNAITFGFAKREATPNGGTGAYGCTVNIHWTDCMSGAVPPEWEQPAPGEKRLLHSHAALNMDNLIVIERFRKMKYPNLQQVHRFYFGFAVLLCHELAHAIGYVDRYHYQSNDTPLYRPEPLFLDKSVAECGYTWESFMFGGQIDSINIDVSCQFGLAVRDFPDPPPEDAVSFAIPMEYVWRIQQEEIWQDEHICDATKAGRFTINRDGLLKCLRDAFTTTLTDDDIMRSALGGSSTGPPGEYDEWHRIEKSQKQLDRVRLEILDPENHCLDEFRRTKRVGYVPLVQYSQGANPGYSPAQILALNTRERNRYDQMMEAWSLARGIVIYEEAQAAMERAWDDEDKETLRQIHELYDKSAKEGLEDSFPPPRHGNTPENKQKLVDMATVSGGTGREWSPGMATIKEQTSAGWVPLNDPPRDPRVFKEYAWLKDPRPPLRRFPRIVPLHLDPLSSTTNPFPQYPDIPGHTLPHGLSYPQQPAATHAASVEETGQPGPSNYQATGHPPGGFDGSHDLGPGYAQGSYVRSTAVPTGTTHYSQEMDVDAPEAAFVPDDEMIDEDLTMGDLLNLRPPN